MTTPRAAAPERLRFDHHPAADVVLGIGTGTPRLSWYVPEADVGWRMTGYEVEVTRDGEAATTVRVAGDEQHLVPWPVDPLTSRQDANVRVRTFGDGDAPTSWSASARVEAGLLDGTDWTSRFIEPDDSRLAAPAQVLSGALDVPGEVTRARLYITAHGLYVPTVNGSRVGGGHLTPGWTSYRHRLRYQTYDLSALVRSGENRLDVLLGNGWFRGRLGFTGQRAQYGDRLGLLAQLEVTTADGTRHTLGTDGSWTSRPSNVLADDLYDGQRTDLRRPALGDPADDRPVRMSDDDAARLVAPDGPPVRTTAVLPALDVSRSPSGKTLVDFAQNAVGWVRLRVRGLQAGSEVIVRHAEVLEDGELGVRPLRSAQATDSYLVAGPEQQILEPSLTFHGFRYAEITGVPDLVAADAELVVIGSDLERTGWFDSSHDLLNRFHRNVVWGMRGNFVDVPTDCPQRDERLGWTGDIQAFAPTASFLFDTAGFLTSWLDDLAAEQAPDGSVPFVIPDVLQAMNRPVAAWGDAATVVPWTVYERAGDAQLLARQLPSMRAWVDCVADLAGGDRLWTGGFQFGDWLDPAAPPDDPAAAVADPDVLATAYFARSAELVARAAEVVGDTEVAQRYAALAAEIRDAFARAYLTPSGRLVTDAITLYGQAICWGLLPDEAQRRAAGRRLVDLVRASAYRISTGFVGTPLICDALTAVGALEDAYRLLLQTRCPSWLYPVTMGATTVWERWDSMLPDGRVNPGQMTSFNHYALGAVADWLHRTVAGLAPGAPGYREILIQPLPGPGLDHASARHLTPYGPTEVSWRRTAGRIIVETLVPVGSEAVVRLPDGSDSRRVGHGRHRFEVADPVSAPPSTGVEPDATVRDVLDDPATWDAAVAAAVDSGVVRDDAELAARLLRYFDRPARELFSAVTMGRMRGDAEAFARHLPVALQPR